MYHTTATHPPPALHQALDRAVKSRCIPPPPPAAASLIDPKTLFLFLGRFSEGCKNRCLWKSRGWGRRGQRREQSEARGWGEAEAWVPPPTSSGGQSGPEDCCVCSDSVPKTEATCLSPELASRCPHSFAAFRLRMGCFAGPAPRGLCLLLPSAGGW